MGSLHAIVDFICLLYIFSLSLFLLYYVLIIVCLLSVWLLSYTLQFLLLICTFFILRLHGKFYPLDKLFAKKIERKQVEHNTYVCKRMRHKERKSDVNPCLQLMTRDNRIREGTWRGSKEQCDGHRAYITITDVR